MNNKRTAAVERGFTLVELAIVMVVIGLIIGGVLGGQTLIRQSELRSVIADVDKYKAASNMFREKYNALPGDMINATRYWGIAGGDGSQSTDCANGPINGTATCNGNGDGRLVTISHMWQVTQENFRFWQHLSNAEILPVAYTGKGGPAAYYTVELGVNAPASKIAGAGFMPEGPCSTTDAGCDGSNWNYGGVLHFGALGGQYTEGAVFTGAEAYQLDAKIDDGAPGRGQVRPRLATNANCHNMTTAVDAVAAVYNTTNVNIACNLNFLRALY